LAKKKSFCYEHPRPAVSVDMVVFAGKGAGREILLIKRKRAPFKGTWAIPGGFVEIDEPLEDAAARELQEETGLERVRLRQFGAFGDPDRDPRGRTISIAFTGELARRRDIAGSDDAEEAAWFPLSKLPRLGFDHRKIIRAAVKWLERQK
jgi:8-oxo-dGTP diphosphatase